MTGTLTYTEYLNLVKPSAGYTSWNNPINSNFDVMENKLSKAYKYIWNEDDVTYITNNAKYVTDHWERWDNSKGATLIEIDASGNITQYYCAAGTGTISWIENIFGDGSDGAVTLSSDTDMGGIYNYTTFDDGGYTIFSTDKCLIIRATNLITISGTIDASGKGGSGSSGQFSEYIGTAFSTTFTVLSEYQPIEKGIIESNLSFVNNISVNNLKDEKISNFINYNGGSGGFGGYGYLANSGWARGGVGGNGGGIVILIAPIITITGTVNVSGDNGSGGSVGTDNTYVYIQSGSGGDGGLIVLGYLTLNESSATYNYSGGIYGSNPTYSNVSVANGTNGEDGIIKKIEV